MRARVRGGRSVDAVTIAFGLRNVTRTLVALQEANRVLRRPAPPPLPRPRPSASFERTGAPPASAQPARRLLLRSRPCPAAPLHAARGEAVHRARALATAPQPTSADGPSPWAPGDPDGGPHSARWDRPLPRSRPALRGTDGCRRTCRDGSGLRVPCCVAVFGRLAAVSARPPAHRERGRRAPPRACAPACSARLKPRRMPAGPRGTRHAARGTRRGREKDTRHGAAVGPTAA